MVGLQQMRQAGAASPHRSPRALIDAHQIEALHLGLQRAASAGSRTRCSRRCRSPPQRSAVCGHRRVAPNSSSRMSTTSGSASTARRLDRRGRGRRSCRAASDAVRRSSRRSAIIGALARAQASAIAKPMPRLPPDMKTTRPAKLLMMSHPSCRRAGQTACSTALWPRCAQTVFERRATHVKFATLRKLPQKDRIGRWRRLSSTKETRTRIDCWSSPRSGRPRRVVAKIAEPASLGAVEAHVDSRAGRSRGRNPKRAVRRGRKPPTVSG